MLSAIGAVVFFGWLASEGFEGEAKVFDDAVRNAVHQTTLPFITATMVFFTYLGSVWGITALFAFASAILIYLHHKRAIIILWMTMAGEVFLEITLKTSFQRSRPMPFLEFPLPSSYSIASPNRRTIASSGIRPRIVASPIKNSVMPGTLRVGGASRTDQ